MPSPLPIPRKITAAIAVAFVIAGCQPTNTHAVPSVAQIGGDLKCASGDHGFEDLQAGWGFCYPGTWQYIERAQGSQSPPGLDLTFDVTDVPCSSASPGSKAVCSPNAGRFGFMIISTYERGTATSLADWERSNLPAVPDSQSISWGNSVAAAKFTDGRRIALTNHHIVIMDLRSSNGLLDLEAQMSARLDTWKFKY
jgi:hypothetical protein